MGDFRTRFIQSAPKDIDYSNSPFSGPFSISFTFCPKMKKKKKE